MFDVAGTLINASSSSCHACVSATVSVRSSTSRALAFFSLEVGAADDADADDNVDDEEEEADTKTSSPI